MDSTYAHPSVHPSSTNHRLLGTPDDDMWPGVSDLPNYKTQFPKWRPQPLPHRVPRLSADGVDLLARLLRYEPTNRVTCKEAQLHPYFADLPKHEIVS